MLHYDLPHNSTEWFTARIGIPTSSCFDNIITPTGKPSAQADGYANMIIAEMILQEPLEKFKPSYWMERGAELEMEAAKLYEFHVGESLVNGGFITTDDWTAGASPDRLVGTLGLAEIKCPAPWTHVEYLTMETLTPKYIPQVQGQLYVAADREWVDWFSYHPEMPPARIRTYRDEEFIKKLDAALDDFHELLHKKLQTMIRLGAIDQIPEVKPPAQYLKSAA